MASQVHRRELEEELNAALQDELVADRGDESLVDKYRSVPLLEQLPDPSTVASHVCCGNASVTSRRVTGWRWSTSIG